MLVAGLGLTLVDQHLALRKDIAKIKIVELNEEVIEMVAPHLPKDERFEVVHGDFFEVLPQLAARGEEYDTIIMDIWTGEDERIPPRFQESSRPSSKSTTQRPSTSTTPSRRLWTRRSSTPTSHMRRRGRCPSSPIATPSRSFGDVRQLRSSQA